MVKKWKSPGPGTPDFAAYQKAGGELRERWKAARERAKLEPDPMEADLALMRENMIAATHRAPKGKH